MEASLKKNPERIESPNTRGGVGFLNSMSKILFVSTRISGIKSLQFIELFSEKQLIFKLVVDLSMLKSITPNSDYLFPKFYLLQSGSVLSFFDFSPNFNADQIISHNYCFIPRHRKYILLGRSQGVLVSFRSNNGDVKSAFINMGKILFLWHSRDSKLRYKFPLL